MSLTIEHYDILIRLVEDERRTVHHVLTHDEYDDVNEEHDLKQRYIELVDLTNNTLLPNRQRLIDEQEP